MNRLMFFAPVAEIPQNGLVLDLRSKNQVWAMPLTI